MEALRDGAPSDVPRLLEVYRLAAAAAPGIDQDQRDAWAQALGEDDLATLVQAGTVRVEEDGGVTGFAAVVGDLLHMVYVHPALQGGGTGRRLVRDAERRARGRGLRRLRLHTAANAVGFYQHLGFEITGQEDIDLGGRPLARIRMARDLD